jgi:hypothetical protein
MLDKVNINKSELIAFWNFHLVHKVLKTLKVLVSG